MNGNRKGSSFERKIAVQLSLWWSEDVEGKGREDIFWRCCQSGGRATIRGRLGKTSTNQYGDIAAVDPVGAPLLKVFTLELKRGRSHGDIGDMLDAPLKGKPRPFEKTLEQAIDSQELAGSLSWLLISQRDRRRCLVIGDWHFMTENFDPDLPKVYIPRGWNRITYFPLNVFLRKVTPSKIIKLANKKL